MPCHLTQSQEQRSGCGWNVRPILVFYLLSEVMLTSCRHCALSQELGMGLSLQIYGKSGNRIYMPFRAGVNGRHEALWYLAALPPR